jgi:hypothetical protein
MTKEDVILLVSTVNGDATQNISGFPKMAFESGKSGFCHVSLLNYPGSTPIWDKSTTEVEVVLIIYPIRLCIDFVILLSNIPNTLDDYP